MNVPDKEEFLRGVQTYEKKEERDAMYAVATSVISQFWGKTYDVTNGLGVLLLTWNQAFYRYGSFSFDKLEECLKDNIKKIESFRKRDISTLSDSDERDIVDLFDKLLKNLQITEGKRAGDRSPVAVAKALHLLAPRFFPLWDDKIARAYMVYYSEEPAKKYVTFCKLQKDIAQTVKNYDTNSKKPLLKLIDEYNYSKYTKSWI